MKKSIRNTINLVLGIMAAMLSGLFGQRLFAKCRPVQVMYGAPNPEYLDGKKKPEQPEIILPEDAVPAKDTIKPQQPDTTILPPPPEQPMCKYGPPSDWW